MSKRVKASEDHEGERDELEEDKKLEDEKRFLEERVALSTMGKSKMLWTAEERTGHMVFVNLRQKDSSGVPKIADKLCSFPDEQNGFSTYVDFICSIINYLAEFETYPD
ncbi:14423_t:CDS:2 [Funneliformis geosporum]|uniref:14423_t:CDS:1 n=1 Tax=Funneliformis geosporum TaxID=1117311 RepID=A0A9W4SPJ9_9GLOM|nr:14423_t:CDS:2 [Funneliformis geosporum]